MGLQRQGDHWLWVGGPVPPGAAAITLGPLVSIRRRSADNPHLLAHEAEHVRQYRERGVPGFLVTYLADYLHQRARGWPHWAAYRRLGLEVEAEWLARRPDQRRGERPDRGAAGSGAAYARRVRRGPGGSRAPEVGRRRGPLASPET